MDFSKRQKKIIKAIDCGDVYDIPSFIEKFNAGERYKADLETAEERFKKSDYSKPQKVDFKKDITDQNDENEEFTYTLTQEGSFEINCLGFEDHIGFEDQVYICKDYFLLNEFLAIWEYLKQQLAVIEVSKKKKDEKDYRWIYKKIPNKQMPGCDSKYTPIIFQNNPLVSDYNFESEKRRIITIDAIDFIPEKLDVDEEKIDLYEKYIGKKIIPTAVLDNFVHNGCMTEEQKRSKKSLLAAWIAIFSTVFSVLMTCSTNPPDNALENISWQLNNILQKIDEIDVEIDDNAVEVENDLDIIIQRIENYIASENNQ